MRKLTLKDLPKRHLVKLCEIAKIKLSQQEIAAAYYLDGARRFNAMDKRLWAELDEMDKIRGCRKRDRASEVFSAKADRHMAFGRKLKKMREDYDLETFFKERSKDGDSSGGSTADDGGSDAGAA